MSRAVGRLLKRKGGSKKNETAEAKTLDVAPDSSPKAGGGGGEVINEGSNLVETPTPASKTPASKAADTPASKPEKGSSSGKSRGFHMPPVQMPGKGTARKMASAASAFKKKINLKKKKRASPLKGDGSELLAVDDEDGASWLEDSDEDDGDRFGLEATVEDVEASPDTEAGMLATTFAESARSTPSTTRSRTPERSLEDADWPSSEADGSAAASASSPRVQPGGFSAHSMEIGCAPGPGSGTTEEPPSGARQQEVHNFQIGDAVNASGYNGKVIRVDTGREEPYQVQVEDLSTPKWFPGTVLKLAEKEASSSPRGAAKDANRPRPQAYGAATNNADSSRISAPSKPPRPVREKEVTWDAKRFKNVKPLQCSSIWDIPTSKDPNPEPRPTYSSSKLIKSLMRTPQRGSSAGTPQKAFGSADLPVEVQPTVHRKAWYTPTRRKVRLVAAAFLLLVSLTVALKMFFT